MTPRQALVSPNRIEVVPAPSSGDLEPGWVRLRVLACGLCGSDHHLWQGMTLPPGAAYPMRPGHEVAGEIVSVGEGVDFVAVGQQVVAHPLRTCGDCAACRAGSEHLCPEGRMLGIHDAGGLADLMDWPAARVVPFTGLPATTAALLPDAVATAYHGWRMAQLAPGGTMAVLGAGGVGTHLLQVAAHLDPRAHLVAVVRSPATRDRIAKLPVTIVESGLEGAARAVRQRVGTVDAVVDFTGASGAAAEAVRMVSRGGVVVLGSIVDEKIDLGVSVAHLVTREITVRASFSSTLDDLRAVVALAGSGALNLSDSVSHRFPLDQVATAMQVLHERPPGLMRVVVEP